MWGMQDSDETEPLEEILVDAEERKKQFNEARQRLQEVRARLHDMVDTLASEGTISAGRAGELESLIDNGKYEQVREEIQAARQESLEFEDEEKDAFASAFAQSFRELEANVEDIRTSLLELGRGVDREDMVAFLYGKHNDLTKRDLRAVFDALEEVERRGLSDKQLARVLQAYESDLNIEPTTTIVKELRESSGGR